MSSSFSYYAKPDLLILGILCFIYIYVNPEAFH